MSEETSLSNSENQSLESTKVPLSPEPGGSFVDRLKSSGVSTDEVLSSDEFVKARVGSAIISAGKAHLHEIVAGATNLSPEQIANIAKFRHDMKTIYGDETDGTISGMFAEFAVEESLLRLGYNLRYPTTDDDMRGIDLIVGLYDSDSPDKDVNYEESFRWCAMVQVKRVNVSRVPLENLVNEENGNPQLVFNLSDSGDQHHLMNRIVPHLTRKKDMEKSVNNLVHSVDQAQAKSKNEQVFLPIVIIVPENSGGEFGLFNERTGVPSKSLVSAIDSGIGNLIADY